MTSPLPKPPFFRVRHRRRDCERVLDFPGISLDTEKDCPVLVVVDQVDGVIFLGVRPKGGLGYGTNLDAREALEVAAMLTLAVFDVARARLR